MYNFNLSLILKIRSKYFLAPGPNRARQDLKMWLVDMILRLIFKAIKNTPVPWHMAELAPFNIPTHSTMIHISNTYVCISRIDNCKDNECFCKEGSA